MTGTKQTQIYFCMNLESKLCDENPSEANVVFSFRMDEIFQGSQT